MDISEEAVHATIYGKNAAPQIIYGPGPLEPRNVDTVWGKMWFNHLNNVNLFLPGKKHFGAFGHI